MLELIRRCQYCRREMKVSDRSYAENPFCNRCLNERISISKAQSGATGWKLVGGYLKPILAQQKAS